MRLILASQGARIQNCRFHTRPAFYPAWRPLFRCQNQADKSALVKHMPQRSVLWLSFRAPFKMDYDPVDAEKGLSMLHETLETLGDALVASAHSVAWMRVSRCDTQQLCYASPPRERSL